VLLLLNIWSLLAVEEAVAQARKEVMVLILFLGIHQTQSHLQVAAVADKMDSQEVQILLVDQEVLVGDQDGIILVEHQHSVLEILHQHHHRKEIMVGILAPQMVDQIIVAAAVVVLELLAEMEMDHQVQAVMGAQGHHLLFLAHR
jgi:hypothetical protein